MPSTPSILLTETPRDALQGMTPLVPAKVKAEYIDALLKVGFHTVDVGSFVSPKAVPQMADTAQVLDMLDTSGTRSRIMVLAGNAKGGLMAALQHKVQVIAYPYSVSPTFLKRNLNTTPVQAWETVRELQHICLEHGKTLQVYLAMAFGNPYGDEWSGEMVLRDAEKLRDMGISNLSFSDITGEGSPESIGSLCSLMGGQLGFEHISLHLHSDQGSWLQKVEAAYNAGVRHFEGAVGGVGGCPMTGYELLANLDTWRLNAWCESQGINTGLDMEMLRRVKEMAQKIF